VKNYPCSIDPEFDTTNPGIESGYRASPEAWREAALEAVKEVASRGVPFATPQVWDLLDRWGVTPPKEPRGMGGVMVRARKLGLIVPTGGYLLSDLHASGHTTPRRLYVKA
jgi:hypothetical protein